MRGFDSRGLAKTWVLAALVSSVGVFAGQVATWASSQLSRLIARQGHELGSAAYQGIGGLLTLPIAASSIVIVGLVVLYGLMFPTWRETRFRPGRVTNALVYLLAVSVIFPPLPQRLILVLVVVSLLVPGSEIRGSRRRWFWVGLGVFCLLTVIGVGQGLSGLDPIRARIPISLQFSNVLSYVSAFMVFFVVTGEGWGSRQFEVFFKVIVAGGALFGVEALGTWYLGWDGLPPPFISAVDPGGMFRSSFAGWHHYVARVGLIMIFLGLSFYEVERKALYLLGSILGSLILVATLDRAPALAALLGLGLYFSFRGSARAGSSTRMARVVIISVLSVGLTTLAFDRITKARETNTHSFTQVFAARVLHVSRAVDVFVHKPLTGTGAYLDPFYQGSSLVEPVFFDGATRLLGVSPEWAMSRLSAEELRYQDGISYSAHNFWVEVLMNWGVAGALLIFYLVVQAWDCLRRLMRLSGPYSRAAWARYALALSLSASVMTTSKFRMPWLYLMVFLYVGDSIRVAEEHQT